MDQEDLPPNLKIETITVKDTDEVMHFLQEEAFKGIIDASDCKKMTVNCT